jgi:FtsZ-binding cell division protein ZapB
MIERLQYGCDEHGWCDFTPCPQCTPPKTADIKLIERRACPGCGRLRSELHTVKESRAACIAREQMVQVECERLRGENAALKAERDEYRRHSQELCKANETLLQECAAAQAALAALKAKIKPECQPCVRDRSRPCQTPGWSCGQFITCPKLPPRAD